MMKHCNRCDQDKEESEFWHAKRGKNGLDWWCIDCRKKSRKESEARPIKSKIGRKPHTTLEGMRWCSGCQQPLPVSRFTGKERTCKLCKQDRHFLRTYGITRRDYDEMVKRQGGICAICKRRDPVYIDHDHKTGEVRGILCQQCNTGLGYFFDDCEIIQRAAEYCAAIARNE